MKTNLYKGIVLFTGLLSSSVVLADLSVNAKNWPSQLPEDEYDSSNYYGNGQRGSFNKAITADGSADLTIEEQNIINGLLPESEVDRWYLKVGMYGAMPGVGSIKNKSTGATASAYTVALTKFSKDVTGFEVGVGYLFNNCRVDAEYISLANMTYKQPSLFTTNVTSIDSTISGQHIIANAYYDFDGLYAFKPFIGGTLGVGTNKTSSTFSGGYSGSGVSKSTTGFDYGAQFGARMKIFKSRFHVSASYRYILLGKVKWVNQPGTVSLQGKRIFNGFSLDLIYLL